MQEAIIQTKSCLHCQKSFAITDKDMEFYNKLSPTFDNKKFQILTPTLCPDCRQRRRLSFRNEKHLYKRKCDASGKDIISVYFPDKPFKVYDQKIRRSNTRDSMSYGRDFDFSKSFTENFSFLLLDVPHMALSTDNTEGCDFTNFVLDSKQCYLLYGGGNNEGIFYGTYLNGSHKSVDISFSNMCEQSYELINCNGCFSCFYSINCNACSECIGCSDCESCSGCINCTGLINAQYCTDNK